MSKYTGKKNVRLYPHKTTGGAEYLSPVAVPGTLEGSFDAPFLIRLDGRPELLGPPLTLIAAAPELMEACKMALEYIADFCPEIGGQLTLTLTAAVAKAEGVTP